MQWTVPLFDLALGDEEKRAATAVLDLGWLTMGDQTTSLEAEFAEAHGVSAEQAVAVTNCTCALQLAYLGAGVTKGDEVILPSLTFVATANAAIHAGAKPVFADVVSAQEPVLDPADVAKRITDKTRAVCVVHYAGWPADMDELEKVCNDRGIALIEDAAHAPGGTYKGRFAGTLGTSGCFSFFSNKNMTCGEGGMVLFADPDVAARYRRLRSHGMTTSTLDRHKGHAFSYDVVEPGFNYRIDEVRAAIARVQLSALGEANRRRRELYKVLAEGLASAGIESCFANRGPEGLAESTVHILPVVLPEGVQREPFMAKMRDAGVQCSFHYPPIHMFSQCRELYGARDGMLPITESLTDRLVTLPMFPHMTETQIAAVIESARSAANALRSS